MLGTPMGLNHEGYAGRFEGPAKTRAYRLCPQDGGPW